MRKESAGVVEDELRPEYDLAQLKGGARGKYYRQAIAGTNLVVIEPDLFETFPDEASVNRALRLLASTANAATRKRRPRRAASSTRPKGKRQVPRAR